MLLNEFLDLEKERLSRIIALGVQSRCCGRESAQRRIHAAGALVHEHVRMEEEVLFPFFERSTLSIFYGPTHLLRADHERVHDALDTLAGDAGKFSEQADAALATLRASLQTHVEIEEQVFKPWIASTLSEGQRHMLSSRLDRCLTDRPGNHAEP